MQDPSITRDRSLALPAHDEELTTPISVDDTCPLSVEVSLPSADHPWAGQESEGAGIGTHPSHSSDLCRVTTPTQQSGAPNLPETGASQSSLELLQCAMFKRELHPRAGRISSMCWDGHLPHRGEGLRGAPLAALWNENSIRDGNPSPRPGAGHECAWKYFLGGKEESTLASLDLR